VWMLLTFSRVKAHDGGAIPADVWTHWNLDPLLLLGLMLPSYLYIRGASTYPVERWRTGLFFGGIGVLAVALISPLHAMSHSLFSAHMLQHLLLILVAAPLLVLSYPLSPLLRGLPARWRKTFAITAHYRLPTILTLHIAALWLWHVPGLYTAALDNPLIHALEHASFLLTAALFWWTIRISGDYGGRVLAVFTIMMASGLLGALMTFARVPWYGAHTETASAWGLTPLADQQLAGVMMWIPMGMVYVVAAAILLGVWLNAVERRVLERESRLLEEVQDA
jgi:putative membrane protein